MSLTIRDPRSTFDSTNAGAQNPRTGTTAVGGFLECAGYDLGNGTAAIVTMAATATTTTVDPSDSSVQLLGADSTRIATTIVNADTEKTLYVGLNGAAAVAGVNPVAPGAAYNVPSYAVSGQTNGIWETGATAAAQITAITV